jgi:hypothetical protein
MQVNLSRKIVNNTFQKDRNTYKYDIEMYHNEILLLLFRTMINDMVVL